MNDDINRVEKEKERILLVDDERGWSVLPKAMLEENGFEVEYEERAENTLSKIKSFNPHAVLLDVVFNNEPIGKLIFQKIKEKHPNLPVIMLTNTLKDTFNSKDYPNCAFPFAKDQLNTHGDPKKENEVYKTFAKKIRRAINKPEVTAKTLIEGFVVGHTMAMKTVGEKILEVAPTSSTVLILGESGTGKELIVNAIHYNSPRSGQPFVKVNCAAFAEGVLESELFGHAKGAFTGAIADKKGVFELADGGTLFLDEIGDISLNTQVKLLRALQEREIDRVGGTKTITVDVRVIAATNKDLSALIKEGSFREDLYYRLHVFPITLPPLRERKEDIPDLLAFFVNRFNQKFSKTVLIETALGKRDYLRLDVLEILRNHDWLGNIRQFEHEVERAMINVGDGNVLQPEHFEIKEDRATVGVDLTPEAAAHKVFKTELTYDTIVNEWKMDRTGPWMKTMMKMLIHMIFEKDKDVSEEILAKYLKTNKCNVKACSRGILREEKRILRRL